MARTPQDLSLVPVGPESMLRPRAPRPDLKIVVGDGRPQLQEPEVPYSPRLLALAFIGLVISWVVIFWGIWELAHEWTN